MSQVLVLVLVLASLVLVLVLVLECPVLVNTTAFMLITAELTRLASRVA